jgi:hypothetical protein
MICVQNTGFGVLLGAHEAFWYWTVGRCPLLLKLANFQDKRHHKRDRKKNHCRYNQLIDKIGFAPFVFRFAELLEQVKPPNHKARTYEGNYHYGYHNGFPNIPFTNG